MKEFAVAYELNGKKTFARYEGKTPDEAKEAFLAEMPNAKVNDVIELDDNLKKILDVVKPGKDKELDDIKADVEKSRAARDAEDRKEQQRKAKFKYMANQSQLEMDPDKKEYLLKLADEVMKTDKDFRKDIWKKLLEKFVTPAEAKEMQKEFEADAKENWKNDKANLNRELEVIRRMFNDTKGKWGGGGDVAGTLTFDEIATAWGCSKPYVIKVYQQAMKKLVAKLLKKDVASDEEVKSFQDKINELNKEARRLAKEKVHGSTEAAKEAEKKAKAAEKEFNQLLKDLNDVRVKFGLPKERFYVRKFAPKDAHLDAFEKPAV